MFEASRALGKVADPKPIVLHNKDGYPIGTDKEKASALRDWYETKFSRDDALEPFDYTHIFPIQTLLTSSLPMEVENIIFNYLILLLLIHYYN